jgi:nitrite reductase (NADH) small subunit
MALVKLTTESELPGEGEAREFKLGGKTVCVANVCLHMGGPLGQGYIDGSKIVCPWHGWEYEISTGALGDDPRSKLAVYPLRIENGDVMIDV